MLEKPDFSDDAIITAVQANYGLEVADLIFLPLGADPHTAVYRVVTHEDMAYFLKLRHTAFFAESSVLFPAFLHQQGIRSIIAPLATRTGEFWIKRADFTLILYPFVTGHNGDEQPLTDEQWRTVGQTLNHLHSLQLPLPLAQQIPRESYAPQWRNHLAATLATLDDYKTGDDLIIELVAFLQTKRAELLALIERTERLAQDLQARPSNFVVCHADIHVWNVLIDPKGTLYIVDWDTLIFAPKERDLMFFGAGLWGNHRAPHEEETLFYQGYGPTNIDPVALTYYRYERIIVDIALYCDSILTATDSRADREQGLYYLKSNFLPNSTLALAYQGDKQQATRDK